MNGPLPTAPPRHWADIVLPGVTKADREVIENARTAIQRGRDLLAKNPLAGCQQPETNRKPSI
jgi:hypothetical protein